MAQVTTEQAVTNTTCCIAGGGPAGIMLGYLLARSGVEVTVLEKWPDFFRDFRGDTIHPSTMQILHELGLLEKFLALPHNETKRIAVHIGGKEFHIADFTHLHVAAPFLGFIPQWDFLNFITSEAKSYPGFHLLMETEAIDVLKEGEKVAGVRAKNAQGEFEIRADLTIGADGRHSTIREKSALSLTDLGAPIDVLWFRLSRKDSGIPESLGYVDEGSLLILIDRDTYWQCGFVIHKGSFDSIKEKGLKDFQQKILTLAPDLAESVQELVTWDQVKLLSVAVDHLEKWYLPGLLCIGDAAHAMSPVGGVGINLAVQDAVAAANILVPAFKRSSGVKISDLEAVQKRRAWPAHAIQKMQVYIHTHVVEKVLASHGKVNVPSQIRLINRIPYLQRIPALVIGIGLRPEHVRKQ